MIFLGGRGGRGGEGLEEVNFFTKNPNLKKLLFFFAGGGGSGGRMGVGGVEG